MKKHFTLIVLFILLTSFIGNVYANTVLIGTYKVERLQGENDPIEAEVAWPAAAALAVGGAVAFGVGFYNGYMDATAKYGDQPEVIMLTSYHSDDFSHFDN